ncbi:MAG: GDP-mannose 4,6-dehydratase, partial [Minisyncoccia bacterium]
EEAGYEIRKIETLNGEKVVKEPTEIDNSEMFGVKFEKTKIDKMLLNGEIEYTIEDKGVIVDTDKNKILIEFDQKRFRPAEVPILMSDTTKIQELGFKVKYKIKDIIKDQLNYFLKKENRL